MLFAKLVNVSISVTDLISLLSFIPYLQHGMTPLMCAAYKGKADMCELLLAQGADINSNKHEHQVKHRCFQLHLTNANKCCDLNV